MHGSSEHVCVGLRRTRVVRMRYKMQQLGRSHRLSQRVRTIVRIRDLDKLELLGVNSLA